MVVKVSMTLNKRGLVMLLRPVQILKSYFKGQVTWIVLWGLDAHSIIKQSFVMLHYRNEIHVYGSGGKQLKNLFWWGSLVETFYIN